MKYTPSAEITAPARRSRALIVLGLVLVTILTLFLGPCQNAASPAQPFGMRASEQIPGIRSVR